ncbi:hypothetical protein AARAC_003107 [Aspergillus arachidicola]|uniref:FMN hydroxy acid dehydrogenase domain-containing protein n=1 Tax=Aspergillus arachidicola TaxID=656916 RepID=A0A2G7FRA9_9EURO|nr:hypothetical protein AARAC_003107 [Aspergillus arachidicola]
MARRGDALGKDVCCIDDLRRLGTQRLTPMVRGMNITRQRSRLRPLQNPPSYPRECAKFKICMGLSSYSTYALEDVILEGQGTPYAIQMCVLRDRSLTLQLLERAEKAGYKALFVPVDVPVLGHRLNEWRNDFRIPPDMSYPNILSNGADRSSRTDYDPSLDWESAFPWLRKHTSMKIWLQGVMSPEDIELAICHGADGIIISNHGGRQLDGVPSTLDALRACAPAAKGKIPIALDGGIRRGSDIFKALALGADYCFSGEFLFGGSLMVARGGVELALKILQMELRTTMALSGCRTIADIQKCYLSVLRPDGDLAKW